MYFCSTTTTSSVHFRHILLPRNQFELPCHWSVWVRAIAEFLYNFIILPASNIQISFPVTIKLKYLFSFFSFIFRAAFSTKQMVKWHRYQRMPCTMVWKASATHVTTMEHVMHTNRGIYWTIHCWWATNRRWARVVADVDRPMNCQRKAARESIVIVASLATQMGHALRRFPISKRTAITSFRTMRYQSHQMMHWWRDVYDERLLSKMDGNRLLLRGNDTGCNCTQIHCCISHRNRSKGKRLAISTRGFDKIIIFFIFDSQNIT